MSPPKPKKLHLANPIGLADDVASNNMIIVSSRITTTTVKGALTSMRGFCQGCAVDNCRFAPGLLNPHEPGYFPRTLVVIIHGAVDAFGESEGTVNARG